MTDRTTVEETLWESRAGTATYFEVGPEAIVHDPRNQAFSSYQEEMADPEARFFLASRASFVLRDEQLEPMHDNWPRGDQRNHSLRVLMFPVRRAVEGHHIVYTDFTWFCWLKLGAEATVHLRISRGQAPKTGDLHEAGRDQTET